ncbi:hypothetical protein FRC10_006255, partial [Ceratobasidium sp. 414]
MIDYSNLRHPPEDPTSGPGSASAICSFGTAPPLLGFHAHRAGTVDGLDPPIPAASNPPSPPMTPPLDEGELDRVAEMNAYVDSLKVKRKHRGSGPSLVKLKCPWCDKTTRRPSELK